MREMDVLKALADSTRLDIIMFLMAGKKNVGQIVVKVKKSQPNISIALRHLTLVGLIEQEKEGREVYYKVKNPTELLRFLESLERLRR